MNKLKMSIIALAIASAIGGASYFALSDSKNFMSETPADAISAFYKEAKQGEIDKAKQYVASEVLEYYKNPSWFHSTITTAIKDEGSKYKKVEPKKSTTKIKGQTATVTVIVTNQDGSKSEEQHNLVKENGEWKLTFQ
jgi:hypothetical protein